MDIKIWDGSTSNRKDLSSVKNPDHSDYIRLVSEIQKLQQAFLTLTQNVKLIPDLQGELNKSLESLLKLKAEISLLTPPADLKQRLEEIEKVLKDKSVYKEVASLRRDIEFLKLQVDKNQLQSLELQETFATDVTAFQNKTWNAFKRQSKELDERLEAIEKKLESVSIQTRIQSLLEELKNNE